MNIFGDLGIQRGHDDDHFFTHHRGHDFRPWDRPAPVRPARAVIPLEAHTGGCRLAGSCVRA